MDIREIITNKWYKKINENSMTVTINLEDLLGFGEEEELLTLFDRCGIENLEIEAPIEFKLCPVCKGKGKHVNLSIDSNGISEREFAEDPQFYEDYLSGIYDVTCHECNGKRVIPYRTS